MRAGSGELSWQPRQPRLNQMRERGLANPAERQRGDGYAQLRGSEIGVEIVDSSLKGLALTSGRDQLSHAAPSNRDQ